MNCFAWNEELNGSVLMGGGFRVPKILLGGLSPSCFRAWLEGEGRLDGRDRSREGMLDRKLR